MREIKTSTKNVILKCVLTGIFSVITTFIGTSVHYSVKNNIAQEQFQNQSMNISFNGEEITVNAQTVADISKLNEELENKNEELQNRIRELEKTIDVSMMDTIPEQYKISTSSYKLLMNGIEIPVESDNVMESEGIRYIRQDVVLKVAPQLIVDEENRKFFVGKEDGTTDSLMKVCPPYEAPNDSDCYGTGIFMMMGKEYLDGFKINPGTRFDLLYNLENRYSELEFDFGHIDNSGERSCVLNFYVDGVQVKTLSKNYLDDVTHEVVTLNGGKQLRIEVGSENWGDGCFFGIANPVLVY